MLLGRMYAVRVFLFMVGDMLISRLSEWDTHLLLWINNAGTEPWDTIFWYGTKGWVGIPLYVLVAVWLAWRERQRALRILLLTALSVMSADLVSGKVLKPAIGRLRPSHDPALAGKVRLLHGYKGGFYSMPSSHAANTAAGVTTLGMQTRHPIIWTVGILWAFLHSFTRMYLGVHYPSDILVGWILGMFVALMVIKASKSLYA